MPVILIIKCHHAQVHQMGFFKKGSIPHSRENFHHSEREDRDRLKNVLNLYKISGEGKGVLLISSLEGGMDPFWNNPITIGFIKIFSKFSAFDRMVVLRFLAMEPR